MASYQTIPSNEAVAATPLTLKRKPFIVILASFCGLLSIIALITFLKNPMANVDLVNANQESSFNLKQLSHPPASNTDVPLKCRVNLLLSRHCEKGSLRQDCTDLGLQHAEYFATLFGEGDERWPAPSVLYARAEEAPRNVKRSEESLVPLGEKFNLPINTAFGVSNKKHMVREIFEEMHDGALCGKLVVINWKHENIPKLARLLGCGPNNGCPIELDPWDYDFAWSIQYMYDYQRFSSKKSGKLPKNPVWSVQGEVLQQDFDILAWNKKGKRR